MHGPSLHGVDLQDIPWRFSDVRVENQGGGTLLMYHVPQHAIESERKIFSEAWQPPSDRAISLGHEDFAVKCRVLCVARFGETLDPSRRV